jgi:hypothetical protein
MSGRDNSAYWVADESFFTLYVNGRVRAEADAFLNHGVIYGPGRLLRKPEEETVVLALTVVIIEEIERRLGLGDLVIFDMAGMPVREARQRLRDDARSFENFDRRPSDDPVREASKMLEKAHAALNNAAVRGQLCDRSAAARDLCAAAMRKLSEDRGLTSGVVAALAEGKETLDAAIHDRARLDRIGLIEAQACLNRAAGLADIYPTRQETATHAICQDESNSDLEKRAWRRRTSKAFSRGF